MHSSDPSVACPLCRHNVDLNSDQLHEALFLRLGDAQALFDLMASTTELDIDPDTTKRISQLGKRLAEEAIPLVTAIWRSRMPSIPEEALAMLRAGPSG
ncbi:uncharacterized protein YbaR (Trm112 family) [Luteibacter sp. Sphag1AF]|uniref:hypothetical protein n=1 Tax=Luteibacter sp. Sphag1AF TaxID=2587031 RepID=UPI001621E221|nr:hypothetical protein [Luteibacter sp. Sphag1AF]MBB3228680.1 uncharacterized protein YbaR (Trm112 family) [Luteibacter sp. Sphag1AF]